MIPPIVNPLIAIPRIFKDLIGQRVSRLALIIPILGCCLAGRASAQTVLNAGFEVAGGWTISNDAALAHPGGVASWIWTTPVGGLDITSTETVAPVSGNGIGISYAGLDSFKQTINFPSAGFYTFSVYANSLEGSSSATGGALVGGAFRFLADSTYSELQIPPLASGWQQFEWTVELTAGTHEIGIENILGGVYAIVYDDFDANLIVIPVPTLTIEEVGSTAELSFPTMSGYDYQLEWSELLTSISWSPLGVSLSGDGTEKTIDDSITAGNPRRFYRVKVSP